MSEEMEITLTRGKVALVDADDFAVLIIFKWHVIKSTGDNWYAVRNIRLPSGKRGSISMHRQLINPPKPLEVDHINRNGLDNRRSNLRAVTHRQNTLNTAQKANKSSQYKGVYKDPTCNRWKAVFDLKYLGLFKTEVEAALAYDKHVYLLCGDVAYLNFGVPSLKERSE